MTRDPELKTLPSLKIHEWMLEVRLLGVEALSDGQDTQLRRHVTDRLAAFAKPSAESGVTPRGFILVSKAGGLTRVFLGVRMIDGSSAVAWEALTQDDPKEKQRPENFVSALPNLFSDEMFAMRELTK